VAVDSADLRERIALRLDGAEEHAPPELIDRLAAFTGLLAKWNRRLNLSGFSLEIPSDDALDRLIVEPVRATRHIRHNDQLYLDIGSGGGSPAVPVKLSVPRLQTLLIEARAKKCAFLREAVRELRLKDVSVENVRLDDYVASASTAVDVITIRAVAESRSLWACLDHLLAPAGRVLWFSTALTPPHGWVAESVASGLDLVIVTRERT
jgi:16S rRNA (guanine527-N7)-methyltransferase